MQMMLPLKVSMLSEKIAVVYLEVSEKYIMPAQRFVFDTLTLQHSLIIFGHRRVGGMMKFSNDTTEEGRAKLKGEDDVFTR
jgi:hypothetical protein